MMLSIRPSVAAALLMIGLLAAPTFRAGADDAQVAIEGVWPGWRGGTRDGKLEGAAWPDSIGETRLKPAWRLELGPSYSGPIVSVDAVFVTETRDQQSEVVRALDRASGRELWRAEWEGAMKVPFFAKKNGSWIRCTPAFDGDALYVGGMRDVLVSLDAETGERRWIIDFPKKIGSSLPDFGFVSSPIIVGDYVYVQAGASFAKVDKRTGEIAWRTLENNDGMYGSAFSSPVLATIAGRRQFLVQTRDELCGVDPESGSPLWKQKVSAFRGMNILTPTVYGDGIFTSNYKGKAYFFKPREAAGAWTLDTAWTNKSQAYMSSPVVIGKHAYLHLENQRANCIDLETGEEKWRTSERFGEYWSMVAQGERILALDESGELIYFRATPEKFDVIERRRISEASTWAHLAVAGKDVVVRELNACAAYRWE